MQPDNKKIIKILLIGLALVLVVYFFFSKDKERKFTWTESYRATSRQPYGTLFIQQLLSTFRPDTKFTLNDLKPLSKVLDTTSIQVKTDYVFIGKDIYLDEADTEALLDFISRGNDAFIASVNLPFNVIDTMFVNECDRQIFLVPKDTIRATFNFYNKSLKRSKGYTYAYRFGKIDHSYYWNTLNPEVFCDSTTAITPLGYSEPNKVNFFKLTFGKGNLFVHTNPIVFTNYFLTKAEKVEYASNVFSHIDGKAIIWDEYSKQNFDNKNNAPDVNPITYILQQQSLRYAWWLMLGTAILYTLFTAKRKQRIIPVLEEKANTSLEYVKMISALHFQNGNHHDIARKKLKYFFYFIRAKYNLHIQALTEVHMKRLSEKSKVAMEDIQALAIEFNHVEQQSYYNEPRLIDLQNALDRFYKTCK